MRGFRRRAGRAAQAGWARMAAGGCLALAVAVTVTQAVGVSPAAAQSRPSPSAVAADTALSWGDNDSGQLGDGTTADSSMPVAVSLPAGVTVTAVAAGAAHNLAVTSAGTVLAWGGNSSGQLGDGTTTNRSTPVAVSLPSGVTVTAVAAGAAFSLALTSAGTILAWGDNTIGQLGDGTTIDSPTPVVVSLPTGVTATAVAAGATHSLAVTSAGTVLAWGANAVGQLGDGTTTPSRTPVNVSLPSGVTVTTVAGGDAHSLALTSAADVLAWGSNSSGQLGDGTTSNRSTPVAVGTTATAVAAGIAFSLALTSAGDVLAWGSNSSGQLGDGTTTNRSTPVAVSLPGGTTATALAGGDAHGLAVTSGGATIAWGDNSFGQLGDGTSTDRATPVPVSLPAGATVTTVAAGAAHSVALVAPSTSRVMLRVTPSSPEAGQDVTLTATVTCTGDTPTGTVTFRDNTTMLATTSLTSAATASHTTTLAPGAHSLTAVYVSSNTCPDSRSAPVSVTVAPLPDDSGLPITGPNLPTTVGTAALFILAGAALIRLTGRRQPASRHLR
ncbi:RCC1 domain-containing protein [Salinispora oceanensis]|uniref:RCC1 domain-containing protein n=1 Tax=Salinispora oceanensis TaxID=1050199 RepID=UPI0003A45DDF|nr:Ig-like domain repeat protein [Salinispora oceanensis]